MNVETESKAVQNLLTSLKRRMARKENIKNYLASIERFCKFVDKAPDQLINEVKEGKIKLAESLQKFVDSLIEQELAPKTVRANYYNIQKFFASNKIKIEAKSVELPIARTVHEDRATAKEEIKLLLKTGDLRQRVLVFLPTSSGVRVGTIPYLQLKHLEKWEEPSTTTPVALNIPSEASKGHVAYATFITPECYEAIQDYLNYRKRFGENITSESYLIRDTFEAKTNGASDSKPLNYYGMKTVYGRMIRRDLRTEKKLRHEFKTTHGFRKFFRTCLDSAGISVAVSASLMGHSAGLISIYTRHTLEELRIQYSKAVPLLTIEKAVVSELDMAKASALAVLREKLSSEAYTALEPIILQAKMSEEVTKIIDDYRSGKLKLEPIKREQVHVEEEEDCQNIVTEEELAEYLKKRWKVVAVLPSGKIVISNE